MIKRLIEISRDPAHLSLRDEQLVIQPYDAPQDAAASIPCEDIGMVLIDHVRTTYTHQALAALMRFGAVVVVCGRDHLPAGLLLPVADHPEIVWRLNDQIAASLPLKKRLWQQIVKAKVVAQARNLPRESDARKQLLNLAEEVRSGDTTNVESQAARIYWNAWLGDGVPFTRDQDGDGVNALLNYGYAVLRAAVARALVSAGLTPALGLQHRHRANPFCLADDVLEPFRPLVDAVVQQLQRLGRLTLDQPTKAALLAVLHQTVRLEDSKGPLMVALHRTAASLVRCFQRADRQLLIPAAPDDDTH